MGTIAQKLEYLNDTRLLLKDNINKINNVLTDESTFRSYPQELFNGYLDVLNNGTDTLWSNLEKVSQTGTEPVLENVETAPMKIVLNGNTIQDGEPTPDTPVEVKVVKGENVVSVQGKNLFDKDNATILQGYFEYSHTSITSASSNRTTYLKVKPNTTYNISKLRGLRNWIGTTQEIPTINTSVSNISNFSGGSAYYDGITRVNVTITTGANDNYIVLNYTNTNSETGEIPTTILNSIQIEQNSQATPYVPYSKTDYPINLGDIELCKIDNYNDFPFKAINGNEYYDTLTDEQKNALNYGSWYVHKAIKKVVLDGTNNLFANKTGNTGNVYATSNITDILPTNSNNISILAITNHFKVYPYASLNNIDVGFAAYERVNILRFKFGTNSSITTLELANQWLSNNNVTLYYVLATPTEEEITNSTLIEQLEAISKAKSVKDKTYITQTNEELPFILDVEAIKEYEVN